MESAEQPSNDLLSKVSQGLVEAGHPATPQSVNPNDESSFEPIKRDFHNWAGSTIEETLGGASSSVNDRTTKGRIGILIDKARRRLKKTA